MSLPSQRKIAVSCRVLTTAMDDGQGFLIVLAPSTSLRPWLQQWVSSQNSDWGPCQLMWTEVGQTHRVSHPVNSTDPVRDSCLDSISKRFLLESYNTWQLMQPLASLAPLIIIWASSYKANAYSAIVAWTNVHTSKIFNPPSTPIGNFARRSSQGYREIKNK